jgi:hypothetical protein
MSVSKEESVEVGVLGSVERLKSEAMMRGRGGIAMWKQLGLLACLLYPTTAELFDKDVQAGKETRKPSEEQSLCNRFVASMPVNELCNSGASI